MLSRVANNLFWMDRYMERSYGLLNLIKTNYNSTLDSGDYSSWNKIMFTYLAIRSENEYKNHQDSISTFFFILFDEKNRYLAKVRADCSIITIDEKSGSIHSLGAQLQGSTSCNGWLFWYLEGKTGPISIDTLRADLRKEMN